MYYSIEGSIDFLVPSFVVLNNHGIAYQIKISLNTFQNLKGKEDAKLFTHLHISMNNVESSQQLFGFSELNEKKIFLALISVSGIGANTAIVVLSSLSPEELKSAILNENVAAIQRVKGIGAKTAQRLILELKDKLQKEVYADIDQISSSKHNNIKEEALSALSTLGLARNAAEKTIDNIIKTTNETLTVEQLIKAVLKSS